MRSVYLSRRLVDLIKIILSESFFDIFISLKNKERWNICWFVFLQFLVYIRIFKLISAPLININSDEKCI